MSRNKQYFCKDCKRREVAARGHICGDCRKTQQTARIRSVRDPIDNIEENRRLAAKAIGGDRKARKELIKKLDGDEARAEKVIKKEMDSAAKRGGQTLFQKLARGRR